MNKFNFRHTLEQVRFTFQIMVRGIGRMLFGTLIALLFAVACYGFVVIKFETGYIAVFDFIATLCTLALALCGVYTMGRKKWAKK